MNTFVGEFACVYTITHKETKRIYIGIADNYERRVEEFFWHLEHHTCNRKHCDHRCDYKCNQRGVDLLLLFDQGGKSAFSVQKVYEGIRINALTYKTQLLYSLPNNRIFNTQFEVGSGRSSQEGIGYVYGIFHRRSKKIYIGSTKNFDRRITEHFGSLRRNEWGSDFELQRLFNTDGRLAFDILELWRGPIEDMKWAESREIGKISRELLLNVSVNKSAY